MDSSYWRREEGVGRPDREGVVGLVKSVFRVLGVGEKVEEKVGGR